MMYLRLHIKILLKGPGFEKRYLKFKLRKMKKSICLSILMSYVTICNAQKPHYVINGKIDGASGMTFILQKNNSGKIQNLDTVVAVNGTFKITGGSVEYPEMVGLVSGDNRKQLYFYLENREINISGKIDSLTFAKITGSKTQDEFESLNLKLIPIATRYNLLLKEYQDAGKAKDTPKITSLANQINSLIKEATDIEKKFIKENPSSFAVPDILVQLVNGQQAAEVGSLINSLAPEVARTKTVAEIKSKFNALRITDIGQKAPDFTMNDQRGNKVSLSSKVGSKLLLIDFWAGWCSPCRKENPNVVSVYNEFHGKGFDILGVSLDQTEATWKKAIADDNLTWTQVSDLKYWNNEAARLYSVTSIPANFLLDKDGIIIAKNLRGEELFNKVKEVLNKK
jgi:peroxiredoxin